MKPRTTYREGKHRIAGMCMLSERGLEGTEDYCSCLHGEEWGLQVWTKHGGAYRGSESGTVAGMFAMGCRAIRSVSL